MEELAEIWTLLEPLRPRDGPFVVGVTGAVAVGKSTFAAGFRDWLVGAAMRTELVCTDGFLIDNAELDRRGLALRKGFPETYDAAALASALTGIRRGPTVFPGYSHLTYDIDPALGRRIEPPQVLIIEGLGLNGTRAAAPPLIDALVYLHADEAALEAWFVDRFVDFWRAGANDPSSFYARFAPFSEAEARGFATQVWRGINLPNLRQHISLARAEADIVIEKAADHVIGAILTGPGGSATRRSLQPERRPPARSAPTARPRAPDRGRAPA
ncbi:MAG TPA: hypothetical protein VGS12_14910 [Caulobacteraceae bacterium]|nr:hypothetical protein [Caulobacteraceae bacterium]